eukprot:scaffold925_cov133-Isochrysis_galbana.AAC.3
MAVGWAGRKTSVAAWGGEAGPAGGTSAPTGAGCGSNGTAGATHCGFEGGSSASPSSCCPHGRFGLALRSRGTAPDPFAGVPASLLGLARSDAPPAHAATAPSGHATWPAMEPAALSADPASSSGSTGAGPAECRPRTMFMSTSADCSCKSCSAEVRPAGGATSAVRSQLLPQLPPGAPLELKHALEQLDVLGLQDPPVGRVPLQLQHRITARLRRHSLTGRLDVNAINDRRREAVH